jgi:hypothetical protein
VFLWHADVEYLIRFTIDVILFISTRHIKYEEGYKALESISYSGSMCCG